MTDALNQLIGLLKLEQLESNLYQGNSLDIGTNRIYGGQVLGQALTAMQLTVSDNKKIHSMHAYFMREGDHRIPITYQVEVSRDGSSFSTRHVSATQKNKRIFIANASFQIDEAGLEYQQVMPKVPGPELIKGLNDYNSHENDNLSGSLHSLPKLSAPFTIRPVNGMNHLDSPRQYTWIKTTRPIVDNNDVLHKALLAYLSDYGLITTALLPHGLNLQSSYLQLASIDHAIWFQHHVRVDDWLLYICEPLATGNARGLAKGRIYNRSGQLVATTMQEGLLRRIKKGQY
jgi:acyl-CoA thioesterase-2